MRNTNSRIVLHAEGRSQTKRSISAEERGRVAIYVDGANLFYAASTLGIQIEHQFFLQYLTANSLSSDAFFYAGYNPHNYKERQFLLQMQGKGYQVIEKSLIQRSDGSRKANLDVEIAVDMAEGANFYDTMTLVSGDGDFTYAVETVKAKGVRVEVIGLYSMTSYALRGAADHYTDLATIKQKICKSDFSVPKPRLPSRCLQRSLLQTV